MRKANEDNHSPVITICSLHDTTSDRDTDQTSDRHHRIAGGVVAAVILRVAQSTDTHRGDRDIITGCEAEQGSEYDQARRRATKREPHGEATEDSNAYRDHVGIIRANLIGPPAREHAAQHGSSVQDRQDLEGESGVEPLAQGVARDVGERDEEAELHQEDARGQEREGPVAEDAEVRVRARVLGRGQPLPDQQVGEDQQREAYEPEDAHRPGPADAVEQAR